MVQCTERISLLLKSWLFFFFWFSPGYVIAAYLGNKKMTTYTKYMGIKWDSLTYVFVYTELQWMYREEKKNADRKTCNLLKFAAWIQAVVLLVEILSEVVSAIAEAVIS